eukprot:1157509-Pelagomonas_calceolata.AAC.4
MPKSASLADICSGGATIAEGVKIRGMNVQQHTNSAHAAASELSALHAALQALLHEGTTNPRGAARPSESAESEVVSETDAEIAALERELQLREGAWVGGCEGGVVLLAAVGYSNPAAAVRALGCIIAQHVV